MLRRISVSIIIIIVLILFVSIDICICADKKAFIDSPLTCYELDRVDGNKVYLKANKNKMCIQALDKVTVVLPDDIDRVQIFVDGVFWKEQDLNKKLFDVPEINQEKQKEVIEKYSGLVKPEYIENAKQYEYLKDKANMQKVYEITKPNKSEIDKKQILQEVFTKKDKEKQLYIFYLFSQSVPDTVLDTVFLSSKKLPQDVVFIGVIRGIDKEKKILQKLTRLQNFNDIEIKIHPFIFRAAGAERVPAIVFGKCPAPDVFESELCDFKYVVYGDISLVSALEMVADKDDLFKKVYERVKNDF